MVAEAGGVGTVETDMRTRGFSLLEIAVTVAILGLIVGIAVPYFGAERRRAADRTTWMTLDVTYARGDELIRLNQGTIPDDYWNVLNDPDITYTDGPSTGPEEVSVAAVDNTAIYAARSPSGRCYIVAADPKTGPRYGVHTQTPCTAANIDPANLNGSRWENATELD